MHIHVQCNTTNRKRYRKQLTRALPRSAPLLLSIPSLPHILSSLSPSSLPLSVLTSLPFPSPLPIPFLTSLPLSLSRRLWSMLVVTKYLFSCTHVRKLRPQPRPFAIWRWRRWVWSEGRGRGGRKEGATHTHTHIHLHANLPVG